MASTPVAESEKQPGSDSLIEANTVLSFFFDIYLFIYYDQRWKMGETNTFL